MIAPVKDGVPKSPKSNSRHQSFTEDRNRPTRFIHNQTTLVLLDHSVPRVVLEFKLKQPNHLRKQYVEGATEIYLWRKWKCLHFPHGLMEMHVSDLPERCVQLPQLIAE